MVTLLCPVCGNTYEAKSTRQKFCSKHCCYVRRQENEYTKIKNLIRTGKEVPVEEYERPAFLYNGKYCPLSCPSAKNCSKRGEDEFEYTSSGGGRWRALRGC